MLEASREFTDLPFVLHGCTGMSDQQVKASIQCGVAKINFGTQIRCRFLDYLRQGLDEGIDQGHAWRLSQYASDRLIEDVRKVIRLAGSENQA